MAGVEMVPVDMRGAGVQSEDGKEFGVDGGADGVAVVRATSLRMSREISPYNLGNFAAPGSVLRCACFHGCVSKRKRRFVDADTDLDLVYVTDRVIAMGFPSVGLETTYRNPSWAVRRFLNARHPGGWFKVYNLCSERSREYDPHERLGCGEWERIGFPDHQAPTLHQIVSFCRSCDDWLLARDSNVVVTHCKAGKGRTGTMLAAYLVHCGTCKDADEALAFFGERRAYNNKGVTIPSQKRFVRYYETLVRASMRARTLKALGVTRTSTEPHVTTMGETVDDHHRVTISRTSPVPASSSPPPSSPTESEASVDLTGVATTVPSGLFGPFSALDDPIESRVIPTPSVGISALLLSHVPRDFLQDLQIRLVANDGTVLIERGPAPHILDPSDLRPSPETDHLRAASLAITPSSASKPADPETAEKHAKEPQGGAHIADYARQTAPAAPVPFRDGPLPLAAIHILQASKRGGVSEVEEEARSESLVWDFAEGALDASDEEMRVERGRVREMVESSLIVSDGAGHCLPGECGSRCTHVPQGVGAGVEEEEGRGGVVTACFGMDATMLAQAAGTVRLELWRRGSRLTRTWLHTAFLPFPATWTSHEHHEAKPQIGWLNLTKKDWDGLHKDRRNRILPANFSTTLVFSGTPPHAETLRLPPRPRTSSAVDVTASIAAAGKEPPAKVKHTSPDDPKELVTRVSKAQEAERLIEE